MGLARRLLAAWRAFPIPTGLVVLAPNTASAGQLINVPFTSASRLLAGKRLNNAAPAAPLQPPQPDSLPFADDLRASFQCIVKVPISQAIGFNYSGKILRVTMSKA